jgi:hypothetical protein
MLFICGSFRQNSIAIGEVVFGHRNSRDRRASCARRSTPRPVLSSLPPLRRALRFSSGGMAAEKTRARGLQALDHHLAHPFEKLEA